MQKIITQLKTREERNHSPTNKRTKHDIDLCFRVDRDLVRTRDGRSTVRAVRVRVVRAEVDVRARDALDALDVGVDDRVAEEIEVEVVLCAFPSVRLLSKPLWCSNESAHLVVAWNQPVRCTVLEKRHATEGTRRTEGLFDFLTGCDETKVNERGDADAEDGVVAEEVDELEGEEEQVNPDGATGTFVS